MWWTGTVGFSLSCFPQLQLCLHQQRHTNVLPNHEMWKVLVILTFFLHFTSSSSPFHDHVAIVSGSRAQNLDAADDYSRLDELLPSAHANITDTPKDRQKRFIYKNVYGTFDVGFLVIVPFMIVLPPFSNLFNKWRNKRSLAYYTRNVTQVQENNNVLYYDDDPFIQKYLERINSYFELIEIFEWACQQRAICEFSADPSKYFPLSELVLANIRSVPTEYLESVEKSKNVTISTNRETIQSSLFRAYASAAELGLLHGSNECHTHFLEKCFHSTEHRLDMPTLTFWKLLERLIGLKVQETE